MFIIILWAAMPYRFLKNGMRDCRLADFSGGTAPFDVNITFQIDRRFGDLQTFFRRHAHRRHPHPMQIAGADMPVDK